MSVDSGLQSGGGGESSDVAALLGSLRSLMAGSSEGDRYRLLSSLLGELATQVGSGGDQGLRERYEALNRRVTSLTEEKAMLQDTVATTRADLTSHSAQLEAERGRVGELQRVLDEQRSRMGSLQSRVGELETELVARNHEIFSIQSESDRQLLEAQRAAMSGADAEKVRALEERQMELSSRAAALREELDQLRKDKNEEIERLRVELRDAQAGAASSADVLLEELWGQLAQVKPAVAEGHVRPTRASFDRLVESFSYLVKFVDEMESDVRVFLSKYTKHSAPLKTPWDVYAKREEVYKEIRAILDPQTGTPAAPLRMRLNMLKAWIHAAAVANDVAIESVASELQSRLMGSEVSGSDPNYKVREFVRADGHELFMQAIRDLRDERMAEVYSRGTG